MMKKQMVRKEENSLTTRGLSSKGNLVTIFNRRDSYEAKQRKEI